MARLKGTHTTSHHRRIRWWRSPENFLLLPKRDGRYPHPQGSQQQSTGFRLLFLPHFEVKPCIANVPEAEARGQRRQSRARINMTTPRSLSHFSLRNTPAETGLILSLSTQYSGHCRFTVRALLIPCRVSYNPTSAMKGDGYASYSGHYLR